MDLGCLDFGCISVSDSHSSETVLDSHNNDSDPSHKPTSASKMGKNRSPRGTSQSTTNALNKFTSQIRKPPHRKSSPLNWFPRKKVDSYLKRKIKMLQEVDGMNLSLDETLGDSNPHYCRVLREKIAAREAAHNAMEARKAALVEASWCRILEAARIQSKEAESALLRAEKTAAEAFEAATAMGVIMFDTPNCPRKPCQIETSTANGGRSTTHTVTASFETAFEVEKQVSAAVKAAFVRLSSCPSFNTEEFKELLRKISHNPDTRDQSQELSEIYSEYESESGSELETICSNDGLRSRDEDCKLPTLEARQKKYKRRQSLEKFNFTNLVDMMLERLRCLKDEELSSLATIVATRGLNAALAEVEISKLHEAHSLPVGTTVFRHSNLEQVADGQLRRNQIESELPSLDKFLVKHMSRLEREVQEAKNSTRNESRDGNEENMCKLDNENDKSDHSVTSSETFGDLGSILVKHSSKFEREIVEAKKNAEKKLEIGHKKPFRGFVSTEAMPDLGSILIKHSSRLEREIEDKRTNSKKTFDINDREPRSASNGATSQRYDVPEVPSLDKCLVKHVSRLEKEVQEAKNRRKTGFAEEERITSSNKKVDSSNSVSLSQENASFSSDWHTSEKENLDVNKEEDTKFHVDRNECVKTQIEQANMNTKETFPAKDMKTRNNHTTRDSLDETRVSGSNYRIDKYRSKHGWNDVTNCESLDKVLVKHVSRLEKERMEFGLKGEELKVKRSDSRNEHSRLCTNEEAASLDQILVNHRSSRLEKEKRVMMIMASTQRDEEAPREGRFSVSRREARERELQEAWGGLSLGNSIKPHLSKLERDKAAWIKAEEEERRRAKKV